MAPRTRKSARKQLRASCGKGLGSTRKTRNGTKEKINEENQQQQQTTNQGDPSCESHPPDCKCLLRGKGFFLPPGMQPEPEEQTTTSRG